MNMFIPIVLVVGTNDYGDVVAKFIAVATKLHVCKFLLVHVSYINIHHPFFDVVCTKVHCLPTQ